ncbi:hypothetical protein DFQ28_006805 [Apophysomyces sp. BC1034]|nr:hypothetical protein DFQ28_006805 [Apophysomyces sp. BC1034]
MFARIQSVLALFLVIASVFAATIVDERALECPSTKIECGPCADGHECTWPNSGGCENAGIPVCKKIKCDMYCLTKRIEW